MASGKASVWQKKVLKKLLHEEEFQQFAARHHHLKGLDTVEQVLEHLISAALSRRTISNKSPNMACWSLSPTTPPVRLTAWPCFYAVSRVRCDVKVVTNRMLTHLEPLSSLFIPVDNINGRTAKRRCSRWTSSCKTAAC